LYAMLAELDGTIVQGVDLKPAAYANCLDALSDWGMKAESRTEEFQRMNRNYRLPQEHTAQDENQRKNQENGSEWRPY